MLKLSEFINDYLYNPNSGYYRKENPIGKDQDFITSPEISSIFGELLALYLLQITADKKKLSLVEMGAGHGTWFFDILVTIHKLAEKDVKAAKNFLNKVEFFVVEISESLISIQQNKLKNFKISWCKNFDEFIQKKSLDSEIIFISNELFDCFAIDQYVKTDIGWCMRLIDIKNQKIDFKLDNFNPKIHQFIEENLGYKESQNAPISAVFEFSQSGFNFANQLFKAIKEFGGIAINIDYGHENLEFTNTLQAISNHQKIKFSDILTLNKKCDITSHVDFLMLDRVAKKSNLETSLVNQGDFLLSLGILTRKEQILKQKNIDQEKVNNAINRLINKEEMGDLFKVHIAWR